MPKSLTPAEAALRDAARHYHSSPRRGKTSVTPTKPLATQLDLSLAYSPGVAYPCLDIHADPAKAAEYTNRGNLVGVVTNGTAVLGLGDIGPLAGKPVMEGKACLFKKFAGIDVFDIELAQRDPDQLVEAIAALEPTLGGINLEDIKAPECFYIEKKLHERMHIPVFHDDQHGTAIISSAALVNGLELVDKKIGDVKIVVSGAGAAAIACLDLMVALGAQVGNIFVCDSRGLIYQGRAGVSEQKARYAQTEGKPAQLAEVIAGADVFLGCSAAGVLTQDMVKAMGPRPIILALANPDPEIRPEDAKEARPDCIIATGRSDYPNQVNNVLCFPYIFRGALDCGASKITEEMKLACVREIADLAKAEISAEVAAVYVDKELQFGPEYIIPTPFDPRLILRIAPAVARAAEASGVAQRPIADFDAYHDDLTHFIYQTGMVMQPVLNAARSADAAHKRIAYAEGDIAGGGLALRESFRRENFTSMLSGNTLLWVLLLLLLVGLHLVGESRISASSSLEVVEGPQPWSVGQIYGTLITALLVGLLVTVLYGLISYENVLALLTPGTGGDAKALFFLTVAVMLALLSWRRVQMNGHDAYEELLGDARTVPYGLGWGLLFLALTVAFLHYRPGGEALGGFYLDFLQATPLVVAAAILIPLAELFFRPFMLTPLRKRYTATIATALSGSLYALAFGVPVVLLLPFGLVLADAWGRRRSGWEPLMAQLTLHVGLLVAVAASPWVRSLFF